MTRRRFPALLAGLFAAAALGLSLPATAQQYKDEYKLSTVLGEAFPWGWGAKRWADLVAEKTDGRIRIKVYPGTSLVSGDQTKEFTALRQGIIDIAVGSTINWSPQVKELNLFALPFLMPDHKAIDALTQGRVGKRLFDILAERDVVPLAWGENGFREVSNSKHPVRTPEDLRGLKMRVVGSPLFLATFNALGANPTQMSWADAQPAMATGAVDGQENPLGVFSAARLHTVGQKHLTLWGYVADPLIFVVNRKVWESWTEADRKAVAEAANQAAKEEIARARAGISAGDDAVLKEIEANGVAVVHLDDAGREAFRKATADVYREWAGRIGADLVKQAEEDVARR
ncbi:DctP family TRAP transporter solute-binding subunit [Pseudothauera rhizosphaerae]|uniref:DctP family TRAP transporter solute-binding subunit n=1 Tax=Pseudothauera rhizosphaerae TaxID=2565932 RepID=A0A4S4AQH8_9RHOO|nr:DctP family TRAP transporter solute-binding subunit [Pseudothauera rhizosphaerae]THF62009.1 DctP family TRAP transporter solute-binding subunit [Pseudothauera rhizosphaerae]